MTGQKQRSRSCVRTQLWGSTARRQTREPGLRRDQTQVWGTQAEEEGEQPPARACADHSQLSHMDVLTVTLLGLFCLLFLCLQAATFLSNGDGVSGQITPSMM